MRQITNPIQDAPCAHKQEEEVQRPLNFALIVDLILLLYATRIIFSSLSVFLGFDSFENSEADTNKQTNQ